MTTYKWNELTKAQQNKARGIREKLWKAGMSASVSQIAKYYDESVDWSGGHLPLDKYAAIVSAVPIAAGQ